MHLFRTSSAENRLLHVTLDELNKKRAAVGAVAAVPLNKRAAEANAARTSQPTRNTGSAVTDPAAASMQRLRDTQAYLASNPSVDPTGSIGKQALEGQALAETYVAPRNLGNEQYYKDQAKFLQDYTATKSNAADGFASSVNQSVDTNKDSPTYGQRITGNVQTASMSQIQQSAIENLRKAGKTDEEIKATLNDPTYLQNIAQTMSNTGLGGTARKSAVLTPAQAQAVLATSRNPNERKAAQDALDAAATQGVSQTVEKLVGTDKNGNPIYMTQTNPNYEAEVEAKRQRMAQEQANKLKVQESEKKMKEFTAGIDTSAFETTKNQLTEAMGMIKNLTPDLQSAVLPALLNLQESNNRISESALKMANTLPTDQEIESNYGSFEAYISKMDGEMKKMNAENKQLQLDVATYNRDAIEIDKQIIDHDANVAEQKQLQANIENEKRLRRQLGKLGLNTDVQALNFLQEEIQKGTDAYNDLKKGNNLVSLKAQLAIGQGYALDVRKAISDYDAQNLQITSQTAEALMKVKQSISTAKSDRDKELRNILKDSLEKQDANAKEARDRVFDANMKMIDSTIEMGKEQAKSQNDLWDRLYDHYQVFGGNNPDMEKALKKQMQNAGIDTSLIPEGIATASEVANYMRQSLEVKKGRPLTSGFTKEFNEIDEGLTLLNDFEQRIEAGDFDTIFGTDARGPVGGRLGRLNPWSATNRFMASSKVIKQIIGKSLEGGVLRKEDEAKYQHIIPNETDGDEVLNEKFDNLRKILKNSRAIKLNNLRRSGYDVSEYSDIDPLYMEEHNIPDTDAQRILDDLSSGNFEGGEYVSMLTTVGGRITQSFDTPVSSVKYGGLYEDSTVAAWGGRHKGVDIAMPVGTDIPAPSDLTIKNVEGSPDSKHGWGLTVVAEDSKGRQYRFSHLSDAKVKKGQTVKKGSLIALSGNSGNSTGPHLDYRVRKNGTYIDPFSLS